MSCNNIIRDVGKPSYHSRGEDKMMVRLVVVIPAYNERDMIGRVVRGVPREAGGVDEVKVLVVDDGSTDGTAEVALEAGADVVVRHHRNMGLGVAFRTGVRKALELGADVIVTIDGDGQFDPGEIPKLVKPIVAGEADVVVGSRFLGGSPRMPFVKRIGNRVVTSLVNFLVGSRFTDTQCGFRAYSREAALRLNVHSSFTYTQEVFIDLVSKGLRIVEVPVTVRYYKGRKSRVVRSPLLYGVRVLAIAALASKEVRPLFFYGALALGFLVSGGVLGSVLFVRWVFTGMVSPYRSLVSVAQLLLTTGVVLLAIALIGDSQARQRRVLDEILYYVRKWELSGNPDRVVYETGFSSLFRRPDSRDVD